MANEIAKPKEWIATMVRDGRFLKAFCDHGKKLEREYKVEEEYYRDFNEKLRAHTPHTPIFFRFLSADDLSALSEGLRGYQCGFESEFVGPLNLKDALGEMSKGDLYSVVFQLAYTVLCMERLGIIHSDLYAESNILVSRLEQPHTATYVVDGRATEVRITWMVHVIDFDQANLWDDGTENRDMFDAMESLAKYDTRFKITPWWILEKRGKDGTTSQNLGLSPCDVMFVWLSDQNMLDPTEVASMATYTAPPARE
jgi:serine/threonine protein kinase